VPKLHRIESNVAGVSVNAYLIEGQRHVVAVDGTLTVSGGRELRRALAAIGKPLSAVLVTHAHPDHYAGIRELIGTESVPILATSGVTAVIARDDALKNMILSPMFGDEWPAERAFPNELVESGGTLRVDEIRLTVLDLGPGESPHDSIWFLGDDRQTVFVGDQIYGQMHCYLADGFWREWLANLGRLRAELPQNATLLPGHGGALRLNDLDWQAGYINSFVNAVREADWSSPDAAKATVVQRVTTYLPHDDLKFLMELSIEPVAVQFGLVEPPDE
jgi:glyoxylase-like metal-dependent hydrolase (beta-lactamase superfamily II)